MSRVKFCEIQDSFFIKADFMNQALEFYRSSSYTYMTSRVKDRSNIVKNPPKILFSFNRRDIIVTLNQVVSRNRTELIEILSECWFTPTRHPVPEYTVNIDGGGILSLVTSIVNQDTNLFYSHYNGLIIKNKILSSLIYN